ncbi:hypothetical protein ANN_20057 [Periplaneta americana]|uniref:Uncharacterized protein n=1 Tax=Periplaneta americana TaxID=6978 RepID=A0ABQ8SBK2_PERAM|nr:hypothetical protein ANN_20057 [Periplaneta americana]
MAGLCEGGNEPGSLKAKSWTKAALVVIERSFGFRDRGFYPFNPDTVPEKLFSNYDASINNTFSVGAYSLDPKPPVQLNNSHAAGYCFRPVFLPLLNFTHIMGAESVSVCIAGSISSRQLRGKMLVIEGRVKKEMIQSLQAIASFVQPTLPTRAIIGPSPPAYHLRRGLASSFYSTDSWDGP